MTDNFLQKLEEKVMIVLEELEGLRSEVRQLKQENITLKTEKLSYTERLQNLVGLLDSVDTVGESQSAKTYALEMTEGSAEYAMA